jgi:HSP20 family protein
MAIVRWQPFSDLMSLRQAMDQLMEDSFVRPSRSVGVMNREIQPLIDMYQTKDEVVVKATVPGVKEDDVEINIADDVLTIKGKAEGGKEVKDEDYLYREHYHASFARSIGLPGSLKAEKAEATTEDGVLTIKIPKAEEAKPKKIDVKAKKAIEGEKKEKK